jgi:tRNA-(ms[2]io[6]A)-hydroxylase
MGTRLDLALRDAAEGTAPGVDADAVASRVPAEIREFLGAPTPRAWLEAAAVPEVLPMLLVDHANCEKKAASTALSLMFRYEDHGGLCWRLSRIAREELRHFEQVRQLLNDLGLAWRRVPAGRYGQALAQAARRGEPGRRVDRLVAGAFIEARSCERFAMLAPVLGGGAGRLYAGLLASEARHFRHYLELARDAPDDLDPAIARLREIENELATAPDTELRFHSGPPA